MALNVFWWGVTKFFWQVASYSTNREMGNLNEFVIWKVTIVFLSISHQSHFLLQTFLSKTTCIFMTNAKNMTVTQSRWHPSLCLLVPTRVKRNNVKKSFLSNETTWQQRWILRPTTLKWYCDQKTPLFFLRISKLCLRNNLQGKF